MKKIIYMLIVAMLMVCVMASPVMAGSDLSIELISPSGANARPIYEDTVVSKITNNTGETMNNLLVYITIIDTKNNIAVAVDEYGSTVDKPRKIDTLAPGETVTIEIPIRFMYVGEYELYTSVMHKGSDTVISSSPITLVMIRRFKHQQEFSYGCVYRYSCDFARYNRMVICEAEKTPKC